MALWLIRAGKHGEDENEALDKGLAIIGWHEMPDVSNILSYEEMKQKHSEIYPNMPAKAVMNNAAQLWAFAKKIEKGDLVVLPLKTRSTIAIGEIVGEYQFLQGRHVRKVEWLKEDIPRNVFGQDLLYSFGAFMTVCQIKRNNAEERVREILAGKPDPHFIDKGLKNLDELTESDESKGRVFIDLEEQSFDQIRRLIETKFRGHNLKRLVEAILNVHGYQTYRAPEGPDGGVDILAGFGPMGFDKPRLCVQVKSGGVQNDSAIRELEGVMSRVGAEQGLFVSWGGFNKTAMGNVRDLFFKVRLWDDKKLIANLLNSYEKLPDEIQAELPMKRIWIVVPEED
ncbi:restriction system protein [Desulfacinum hydrothermale DSM 13146]|uniref:Restriction system protein n=1 Tax=Desulfacinum hydrothermale DSM 13146 TaxID=1121390 RepID=A0A1W1XVQ1_9BACT|nr:restriction endonuclease [Desulfacinum hydrothermale]SMC27957.1 restriction system protein [Desulfacinum hydrothermale DSM 13146]